MKPYKDKVLQFLECKNKDQVPLLGIWGMGGIGKTSLLEVVRDSHVAHDPDHFDHVIFLQAGKGCTAEKMINSIASVLGLGLSSVDQSVRHAVIWNHLADKSFLVLIDDLWDHINLGELGIPRVLGSLVVITSEGSSRVVQRKVVFTTRSIKVCGKMGCTKSENIIHLSCLGSEDSWDLFSYNVGGNIVNRNPFRRYAKKLVEECSGLPKALSTIGRAMSSKKDIREWVSAVDLLMESKLGELNDMDEELFKCLKLSYDALSDNGKDCFLLCSLWFEDEDIPRDKLVKWWIGAGLLDVLSPKQRGDDMIYRLVQSSLLVDVDSSISSAETSHVKIHRLMRRMALWLVNDSGNCDKWLPDSSCRSHMPTEKWKMVEKAWVSGVHARKFSNSLDCPRLTMLVTREVFSLQSIISFKEMLFLDLEGTGRNAFPMEICGLAKFQYLNLSGTKIDALPLELHRLSDLRYLYMRDCAWLQKIATGLILRLKKLVVLDLFCPVGAQKIQYFALLMEELASEKLDAVMLGINVHNRADITKVVQSSRVCTLGLCLDNFEDQSNPNVIDLSIVSPLNGLQELTVVKCSVCTELVAEGNHNSDDSWLFPSLEILELSCLPRLQKITWINAGEFIRSVVIYKCCKIRNATWVQNLPTLKELTITYCPEMEYIIESAELNVVANAIAVGFDSLKRLYLEELPQLSSVSEHGFPFEELSYVFVDRCENLKAIKVDGRINQHKITIDCNTSWWTGLGDQQGIMTPHFVRKPLF